MTLFAFQRGCLFMTSSSGAQMYGGIIPYVAQALAMQKVYKSASGEMSGDIEPHIFARFERLAFLARFNIDEDQLGPP